MNVVIKISFFYSHYHLKIFIIIYINFISQF